MVPRSSPAITSMASRPAPGISGTSMCRQSASMPSFSLRASRSAPQTASASLASSDGWNVIGPIAIQRATSLCFTATPGISVRPRPMTDTASSG